MGCIVHGVTELDTTEQLSLLLLGFPDSSIDKESTLTEVGSKSKHCLNEGCLSRTDITEIPIKHYSDGLL